MEVLVTGGTGYIGLNLVYHLSETTDISVLVRDSSPTEWLPDGIDTFHGDVADADSLAEIFEIVQPDAIAHLAAVHGRYNNSPDAQAGVDWEYMKRVNVEGTENLLACAEEYGVDSVTFTSTIKAHPRITKTEDADYIKSKELADQLFVKTDWSFDYCIVHPTMVVGPRDYRLVHSQLFTIVNSNYALAPPLYVPKRLNVVPMHNVVQTISHSLAEQNDGRYIVSGENIRMRTYLQQIADTVNGPCHIIPVPLGRQMLPSLIDLAASRGVIPVTSDQFNWKHRDVPKPFEDQCPVDGISWRETVNRTSAWYDQMDLL